MPFERYVCLCIVRIICSGLNGNKKQPKQTNMKKKLTFFMLLAAQYIVNLEKINIKRGVVLIAFFSSLSINAQTTIKEIKVVELLPSKSIYLNGGTRSFAGGTSRTYYKIDLPTDTVEWYYIFSTTPNKETVQSLKLVPQLTRIVDKTGLATNAIALLTAPTGVGVVDIFLTDAKGVNNLMAKDMLGMWAYTDPGSYPEGTIKNAKQGKVKIDDITKGTVYLCLRNPSGAVGVNVNFEVAAIVEETKVIPKTETQEKAEMYGSLGWKAYQKGDVDQCYNLSAKAIELDPTLGWVNNNMGLVQLIKNDYTGAIESYSKAITNYKKAANGKWYFSEAIKDLNDLIRKRGRVEGSVEILELLNAEIRKL